MLVWKWIPINLNLNVKYYEIEFSCSKSVFSPHWKFNSQQYFQIHFLQFIHIRWLRKSNRVILRSPVTISVTNWATFLLGLVTVQTYFTPSGKSETFIQIYYMVIISHAFCSESLESMACGSHVISLMANKFFCVLVSHFGVFVKIYILVRF